MLAREVSQRQDCACGRIIFLAGPLASAHGLDFESRICLSSGHHSVTFFCHCSQEYLRAWHIMARCGWTDLGTVWTSLAQLFGEQLSGAEVHLSAVEAVL